MKKISVFEVAYKNLLRKRTRSILTVLGIAMAAWVLVSLFGFNRGYEASLNRDIDNLGFQMLVVAKGCPYEAATLMLKGGTGLRYMQESISDQVLSHPEVEKITPMLMHAIFDPNKGESGGITAYLGVDPATFPAMKSFHEFKQGRWPREREAVPGGAPRGLQRHRSEGARALRRAADRHRSGAGCRGETRRQGQQN